MALLWACHILSYVHTYNCYAHKYTYILYLFRSWPVHPSSVFSRYKSRLELEKHIEYGIVALFLKKDDSPIFYIFGKKFYYIVLYKFYEVVELLNFRIYGL